MFRWKLLSPLQSLRDVAGLKVKVNNTSAATEQMDSLLYYVSTMVGIIKNHTHRKSKEVKKMSLLEEWSCKYAVLKQSHEPKNILGLML